LGDVYTVHYQAAVLPARPHKDKPTAEAAVLLVERWIQPG